MNMLSIAKERHEEEDDVVPSKAQGKEIEGEPREPEGRTAG